MFKQFTVLCHFYKMYFSVICDKVSGVYLQKQNKNRTTCVGTCT